MFEAFASFMDPPLFRALSAVVGLLCVVLIVSSRVHTGVLATAGLALLGAGSLCALDPWAWSERAMRLQAWGVIAISVSVFWRHGIRPGWLRLAMHWDPAHSLARYLGFERRQQRGTGGRRQ